MRLHRGAPRQTLTVTVGPVTTDRSGKIISINAKRRITGLWGLSWHTAKGFLFVGAQFHEKPSDEGIK